jgi:hypothetical protein
VGEPPLKIGFFRHYDPAARKFTASTPLYASVRHQDADLVLLPYRGRPWRPVGFQGPQRGDPVWVIGHPRTMGFVVHKGIVSYLGGDEAETGAYFMVDSGVYPGNSGGPVFNELGEVIGIVSFAVWGNPHLGGAIDLSEIRELLGSVVR